MYNSCAYHFFATSNTTIYLYIYIYIYIFKISTFMKTKIYLKLDTTLDTTCLIFFITRILNYLNLLNCILQSSFEDEDRSNEEQIIRSLKIGQIFDD